MAGESIEYEVCAALLVPLARALRCVPHGVPEQVRVNLGPVDDNLASSLTVTVIEVPTRVSGSDPSFGLTVDDTSSRAGISVWLSLQVTLVRPCWPTTVVRLVDQGDVTETESVGEATEAATASALADGRVLHAALIHALTEQDETFGDLFGFDPGMAWTIGNRQVVRDGPGVGWVIPVTLDLGPFCDFEVCDAPAPTRDEPLHETTTPDEAPPLGSVDVRPRWAT